MYVSKNLRQKILLRIELRFECAKESGPVRTYKCPIFEECSIDRYAYTLQLRKLLLDGLYSVQLP